MSEHFMKAMATIDLTALAEQLALEDQQKILEFVNVLDSEVGLWSFTVGMAIMVLKDLRGYAEEENNPQLDAVLVAAIERLQVMGKDLEYPEIAESVEEAE